MDNNKMYEQFNKEPLPPEAMARIHNFLNQVQPYFKKGVTIDLCCGNKCIGEIVGAKYFYDYYSSDTVLKCDLRTWDNRVKEKADNIIFSHAIEHFTDPSKVLSIIRKEFLADNGRLFIACPSSEPDNFYMPFDKGRGHYSYHTLKSLEGLAKAVGYKILFSTQDDANGFSELRMVLEKV